MPNQIFHDPVCSGCKLSAFSALRSVGSPQRATLGTSPEASVVRLETARHLASSRQRGYEISGLIDTHCHLNFPHFDTDRDEVLQRAKDSGVDHLINVGVDIPGSEQSINLANAYDNIFAAVGIHPHYALDVFDDEISRIRELSRNDKVVAIGEIGLDYFNRDNPGKGIAVSLKSIQQKVFSKFLILSQAENLPVIIHCREAADDTVGIIRECLPLSVQGVMHCFSQDKKCLKQCLDMGLYISFTGNITYKAAGDLRDLVDYVPLDNLLIETDAPFLAPQEFRGKRNESSFIKSIAEEIARIKKIDFEVVAKTTSENAIKLFKLK